MPGCAQVTSPPTSCNANCCGSSTGCCSCSWQSHATSSLPQRRPTQPKIATGSPIRCSDCAAWLADGAIGSHSDLWEGLKTTVVSLDVGDDPAQQAARDALGVTPLGSMLWSQSQTADINTARINNTHLLDAVRSLTFVHDDEAKALRPVDYQNLGTEELGSVYESLLELHAITDPDTRTFTLASAAGSERKTTGSYYTPPELISRLLDSALNPVIKQAAKPATSLNRRCSTSGCLTRPAALGTSCSPLLTE